MSESLEPGKQCLIDCFQHRGILIDNIGTTAYFTVFVLPFSRLIHLSVSDKQVDAEEFIKQLDEAFLTFGGIPEKCLYDKGSSFLSDIINGTNSESFRNYVKETRVDFGSYNRHDFKVIGTIERVVNFVEKNSSIGDKTFSNWQELEQYVRDWVTKVANQRQQGSSEMNCQEYYDQLEKKHMRPYLSNA